MLRVVQLLLKVNKLCFQLSVHLTNINEKYVNAFVRKKQGIITKHIGYE